MHSIGAVDHRDVSRVEHHGIRDVQRLAELRLEVNVIVLIIAIE